MHHKDAPSWGNLDQVAEERRAEGELKVAPGGLWAKIRSKLQDTRGLTMPEAMLVLLILGIVVGFAYRYYNQTREDVAYTGAIAMLASTRGKIQDLFRGQDYTSLSADELVQAGVLPRDIVRGSVAVNPWNGDFIYTGNSSSFSLQFTRVSRIGCNRLLMAGNDYLDINGVSALPISPTTALGMCSDGNVNTITFNSN